LDWALYRAQRRYDDEPPLSLSLGLGLHVGERRGNRPSSRLSTASLLFGGGSVEEVELGLEDG
jgi:hypothetical protein